MIRIQKERRRHFFINRPLQLRYMLVISSALLLILLVSLANLYFGIWAGVLNALSNEQIRNDLLTASRLQEYEQARSPAVQPSESPSLFTFIRQAERLSERQREVFKDLLNQTNKGLVGKLIFLLLLIAWGTVFLSHKIAGPLYRFQTVFHQMARGDLSVRCQLRKFDEAKAVAEALNQALESLDFTVSRLKNIIRENEKNPERLLDRLKEDLSKFKTSA